MGLVHLRLLALILPFEPQGPIHAWDTGWAGVGTRSPAQPPEGTSLS
jgi:hypothetical protein